MKTERRESSVKTKGQTVNPKLRELVLYIASRSETDPLFGKVKINKLLFYSDFCAYLHFGKSITGEEYQALQQGPAPRGMLPVLKELEKTKRIAIKKDDDDQFSPHKIFALVKPDISAFTAEEIDLVNRWIENLKEFNGSKLSDWSHRFYGWAATSLRETIPYETALIGSREPSLDERKFGEGLAELANLYHSGYQDAKAVVFKR